jgi:hypothetical protein
VFRRCAGEIRENRTSVVVTVVCLLAVASIGVLWTATAARRKPSPTTSSSAVDGVPAEVARLVVAHEGAGLVAALLAGLFAAGPQKRDDGDNAANE